MPQLKADLARLVAIPSISAPGFPEPPGRRCSRRYELVVGLFRDAGVETLGSLDLPGHRAGHHRRDPGAAGRADGAALLHYDVVPVGRRVEVGVAAVRGDRARRRASTAAARADSKSNILMHVGALRAWEGKPPVGIKIVIEGQEEVGQRVHHLPADRIRELFAADAMVIGDMGSVRPGVPTLTVALRGMAMRHRRGADARRAEAQRPVRRRRARRADRAAARARDAARRATATSPWTGCGARSGRARPTATRSSASSPRSCRGCRSSAPAASASASGRARRSRSRASTCRRSTARSTPSSPYARAKINLRVHPEQDPVEAQAALVRHLEAHAAVRDRARGPRRRDRHGLRGEDDRARPTRRRAPRSRRPGAASRADRDAAARSRSSTRSRGRARTPRSCWSAPPTASPTSTRPNERVLLDEFEKAVVAEAEFFGRYAERRAGGAA